MNTGVIGGTFDPIHMGHLILAQEARMQLQLGEVLFVPAGQPWLKMEYGITAVLHRVEMVRRAIAGNPYFKLCTLEVDRPGPSYTVDTLTALKKQRGSAETFFFILGGDTLADLPLWKEPEKLMQLCRFGVAPRSSSGMNLHSLEASLPGVMKNIIPINMPLIETSSSDIRQRVARGLPIRYLVPDEVERYITEQKLYSEG